MSEAFRCDSCDDFYSGRPAVEIDLTARSWSQGGETFLGPKHAAGHDDVRPNINPSQKISWPSQNLSWELCAKCFTEYVAESLREAIQQGRYGDSDE